ncbi:MAG: 3-keto-disaccharide hydrolase [Planctomycetota bacterium]
MRQRSCVVLVVLISGLATCGSIVGRSLAADRPKTPPDDSVSLFNGKDFTGWEGEMEWWTVEDGAMTWTTTAEKPCKRATYLFWTGGKPGDFELSLKFRVVGGNTGVNYRSKKLPDWDIEGYQADIDAANRYTGILYEVNERKIMNQRGERLEIAPDGTKQVTKFADADELAQGIKPGEWNEMVIVARGPELIHKINGVTVSHAIDRDREHADSEGLIALQVHPGPPSRVQFKDMKMKVLP